MGDPAQSHFLGNQFLIAMPRLAGSYFADTVTYLCKHDEQGALGIVINKPLGARVIDIFDELDISCDLQDRRFTTQRILSGGPVERDKGFIIHDDTAHWESTSKWDGLQTWLVLCRRICQAQSALRTLAGQPTVA